MRPSCFSALFSRQTKPGHRTPDESSPLLNEKSSGENEKSIGPGLDSTKDDTTAQLGQLRDLMREQGVDVYVVPTADAHGSEYVGECDKRRAWISGFTGSAGVALITQTAALLFTDSRYFIQASLELDSNWTLKKVGTKDVVDWDKYLLTFPKGSTISIDPSVISYSTTKSLFKSLSARSLALTFPVQNLVDAIWQDRPARTHNAIHLHPLRFAGVDSKSKITSLLATLPSAQHSYLITSLHSIAWVLNLRGSDIEYNPVFYSYLLVSEQGSTLWVQDCGALSDEVKSYLDGIGVACEEYEEAAKGLKERVKVVVDVRVNWELVSVIGEENLEVIPYSASPVDIAEAIKNPVELSGMRHAYLRDGVAWVRFAAWLEERMDKGEDVTEWDAGEKLTEYRKLGKYFAGLAYSNISATNENAALPHYEPSPTNSRIIDRETPYLNDSGAQYFDGTIDTTRTMHFGRPSAVQKLAFTRILQGHAAVDQMIFPEGTTGFMIDVVARRPLWKEGMNYLHGTGHGVGSYLSVHDGTIIGIGASSAFQTTPLAPGHVMSNEPAYYEVGSYGIRIESVIGVKEVTTRRSFGDRKWLGFERFTVVPIQTRMVEWKLMSKDERKWLKEHNKSCREKLEPLLQGDERARKWLRRNC